MTLPDPSVPVDPGPRAGTEAVRGPQSLRVATVPHTDAYVTSVLPPGVVHVGPGDDVASAWLDPGYLTAHADDVDVLHVRTVSVQHSSAASSRWP